MMTVSPMDAETVLWEGPVGTPEEMLQVPDEIARELGYNMDARSTRAGVVLPLAGSGDPQSHDGLLIHAGSAFVPQ